jgi:hypothetical protein
LTLAKVLLLPAKITELKQPKCREKPTILVQLSMQYSVNPSHGHKVERKREFLIYLPG